MDTCVYEVEFQDVTTNEYVTNIIAESIYSKTDPNGNKFRIFKNIINHMSIDKAVLLSDAYEGDTKRKSTEARQLVGN